MTQDEHIFKITYMHKWNFNIGLACGYLPFCCKPPNLTHAIQKLWCDHTMKTWIHIWTTFPFLYKPPTSHHTVSVMGVYCDEQRIHHHVPVPVINPAVMFNFTINMETGNDIHLYTRYCLFKWTPSHQHITCPYGVITVTFLCNMYLYMAPCLYCL